MAGRALELVGGILLLGLLVAGIYLVWWWLKRASQTSNSQDTAKSRDVHLHVGCDHRKDGPEDKTDGS